jgi:ABC-2 type transport system ATP-binding protein
LTSQTTYGINIFPINSELADDQTAVKTIGIGKVIEVTNLVKTFNNRYALRGITFKLDKGEIYGLLGPNGAGKTTTLKILAGLVSPDSGKVVVDGAIYHRDNTGLKKRIAYVPDEPFLYTKLTGEEHLHFFADLYHLPEKQRRKKIDFFFKYFEFEAYRRELVESYSSGTRQKLLISQALLVEPDILLLDEPLASIDPLVSRKFKNYLKQAVDKGTTVIFATHILTLAQSVCSRIGIIVDGKIIMDGSISELMKIAPEKDIEEFYFKTVMSYENPDLD